MPNYTDKANRHELYVHRFASYLRNEYPFKNLNDIYKASRLILLDAEQLTNITQLNKVTAEIKRVITPMTNEMWLNATGELEDFGVNEASFYANMISTSAIVDLSVPVDKKILNYINKSIMSLESGQSVNAGVWADFTKANTDHTVKTYINQIRAGYSKQESPYQISKRLKDISNGMLKNQSESLIRTGTSHYAVQAREAMANDNLDVLEREIPNTTFDNRTTDICISINMKYPKGWPVNKSPIGYPPYHFNCRTSILYMVAGQDSIDGTKASVGGKSGEDAKDSFNARNKRLNKKRNNPDYDGVTASQVRRKGNKDKAFKASQIKADTPFAKWLKSQPNWFVKDTLGKERAELFMAGKLDLANLTDKNLKPLTLEQLKAK